MSSLSPSPPPSTSPLLKPQLRLDQEFEFRDGQRPLALEWLNDVARFYESHAYDLQVRHACRPGANDVLEMVVLESAADLAPNLAHHRRAVRHECIILYLKLAALFDRMYPVQGQFDQITDPDEEEWYAIPSLMRSISASIAPMMVGFVAALEAHYLQADLRVRDVAVAAVTALIQSNGSVFAQRDHLVASIWNLTFLLDVNDDQIGPALLSGTRLPVITSLKSLCGVICQQAHRTLVRELIRRLLIMPGPSPMERDALRTTVEDVFRILVDQTVPPVEGETTVTVTAAGSSPTVLDAYEAIQALLSGRTEAQYDQLFWASHTLTRVIRERCPVLTPATKWLLDQVVLHLNSVSPPLIRYGVAVIVDGVIESWPDLIDAVPDLYGQVVIGCCDGSLVTRDVCISILYRIAAHRNLAALLDLIQSYEHARHRPVRAGAPPNGHRPAAPGLHSAARLSDVLAEAVMYGPNLTSYQLTSLLSSSRYMTGQVHLDTLDLVGHWANRAQDLDPHLVQQLLPMLQTQERHVQVALLSIFRALRRALPNMSKSLLRSSETYFRQLLSGDDDSDGDGAAGLVLVLDVLAMFPLHDLPATRLQKLLVDHLSPKAFSSSAALRRALYTVLAGSRRFWTTNDLSYAALAVLMIGVGDDDLDAVQYALRGFQDVSSGPQWKSASSTCAFHALLVRSGPGVRHLDQAIRIDAFNQIASAVCHWTDQDPLYGVIQELARPGSVGDLVRSRLLALLTEGASTASSNASRPMDDGASTAHSIFWYILLFSKLNIRINQMGAECALRPLLASTHCGVRAAAVDTAIKACFLGTVVSGHILEQTVADAVDVLYTSDNDAVQDSWVCVLDGLVRCQIPHLNLWLTTRLLPALTDLYANRPAPSLCRLVHFLDAIVVNFVANREAMRAADPVMSTCIERVRNVTRQHLIGNMPGPIHAALAQLYAMLAECAACLPAPAFDSEAYSEFLLADVDAIIGGVGQHGGDPLLANLTDSQRQLIGRVSMVGLGACRHPQQIGKIAQTVASLLNHSDFQVRRDAVTAIFQIMRNSGGHVQSGLSSAVWQAIALLTDSDLDVRVELERGLQGGAAPLQIYTQAMRAPITAAMFTAGAVPKIEGDRFSAPDGYDCGVSGRVDIGALIDADYEQYAQRVMQIPAMDQNFLQRIRSLTARYVVSGHETINGAIRNLSRFLSGSTTAGSAAILVSELVLLLPNSGEVYDQLLDRLCREMEHPVTSVTQDKLNGFCVALTSMAESKPAIAVDRVVSWSCSSNCDIEENDGLVYALHAVVMSAQNRVDLSQCITLIDRNRLRTSLRHVLQSMTATNSVQRLALDLHLVFSAISDTGSALIMNLVDLVEALHNPDLQDRVVLALKPQFEGLDPDDAVMRDLLDRADQYGQNGTVTDQHRALTLLSIVSEPLVGTDPTFMGRVLALLADNDVQVRRRTIRMILSGALSRSMQSRLAPVLQQQHRRNGDKARSHSMIDASQKVRAGMAFRLRTSFLRAADYSVSSDPIPVEDRTVSDDGSVSAEGSWPGLGVRDDRLNAAYLSSERFSSIAARYHSSLIYNPDRIVDDAATAEYDAADTPTWRNDDAPATAAATTPGRNVGDGCDIIDEGGANRAEDDIETDVLAPVPPSASAAKPSYQRRTAAGADPGATQQKPSPTSNQGPSQRPSSTTTLVGSGSRARLRRESVRATMAKPDMVGGAKIDDVGDDASLSERIVNDLSAQQLQTMLTATVDSTSVNANSLMEKLVVGLESALEPDDADALRADLKSRLHATGVLVNLIGSLNRLDDRAETSLSRLRRACASMRRRCLSLRQEIIDGVEEQLMSSIRNGGGLNPVMMANQADADRFQAMQKSAQKALVDSDHRRAMIQAAYDREVAIECANRHLSALVTIMIEMVKGFGRLYAYLDIDQMATFTLGAEFVLDILTDDHDGVRKAGRDALQQIVRGREADAATDTKLATLYEKLLVGVYDMMVDDANVHVLRRKKADMCAVLGLLMPLVPDHSVSVRGNCLRMMLTLWDDMDLVVRDCAIDTVRVLGAGRRVPEIDGLVRQTSSGPPVLMQEITTRLNSDTYASKDKLQNLMQWLFGRR